MLADVQTVRGRRPWAARPWPRRSGTRTSCAAPTGEPDLLYIDLHLVHEVTSPQAFDGLRLAGRPVRRPDLTLATEDHNVPTLDIDSADRRPGVSRTQVETLRKNCAEFGVRLHPMGDAEQGIVHVIGPQLGLTQPGMTIVCGDSPHLHPRRVRRAGLRHRHQRGRARAGHPDAAAASRPRRWRSPSTASCPPASRPRTSSWPSSPRSAPAAARATSLEYRGERHRGAVDGGPDDDLQHVDRGGRPGRHDRAGRDHLRLPARAARTRRRAPTGTPRSRTGRRCAPTTTPSSTPRCVIDAADADAVRHLGHQPGPGRCRCRRRVPDPADVRRRGRARRRRAGAGVHGPDRRHAAARHRRSTRSSSAPAPTAGSRTCGPPPRCCAAGTVADGVRMLVVPGSMRGHGAGRGRGPGRGLHRRRRRVARRRLLDVPGHEPGPARARASAARPPRNRNFEGRQGKGGRTHLVSPPVAAATAVTGTLAAPADLLTPTDRSLTMDAFTTHTGTAVPAAPQQRRHRPDHPGRVPQAGHPHRLRGRAVRRLAQRPDFVLNQPAYAGRVGPGRRPGLRHRLVPRARRLGAAGLRLPGRHLARGSATSSAATRSRPGCSPSLLPQDDVEALWKLRRGRPGAPR